jgi:lipoyl-dependent peroxiredoxin
VPADTTVTATVGIGPRTDKGFGLAVKLEINLPGVDRAAAEVLVAEADTICPYSHATRGNIEVKLAVV